MKKFILPSLAVLALSAGTALTAWYYRASDNYTITTNTVVLTNTASRAFRITGLYCQWTSAVTATTHVKRVRTYGSVTFNQPLRSFAVTSATNFYATASEFEGFAFKANDVLQISDNTGAGVTNYVILDTETWAAN